MENKSKIYGIEFTHSRFITQIISELVFAPTGAVTGIGKLKCFVKCNSLSIDSATINRTNRRIP